MLLDALALGSALRALGSDALASFAGDLLGAYDDDDDFRINRDEFRRLAHDMHQLDVTRAAKLFKDMDIDGDGRLSESEFGRLVPALQESGLTGVEAREGAEAIFFSIAGEIRPKVASQLRTSFDQFDVNADGKLDTGEFFRLVGSTIRRFRVGDDPGSELIEASRAT
mmetsp:Transcript_2086/g.4686  ORF Transcript_2086/g.4686 Transcript_2086/m.4686 type:complete len:168 (-) Transcript_2086:327-830(-)